MFQSVTTEMITYYTIGEGQFIISIIFFISDENIKSFFLFVVVCLDLLNVILPFKHLCRLFV